MDAVLEGIVTTQKKGGFKAFVWMGDVVCLITVVMQKKWLWLRIYSKG
jgi:hypothetical protein